MEKNDVTAIAQQFGLTPEVVEASEKDGTLGQRIKDSLSKKVIYDPEKFDEFKTNYKKETENAYFQQLVENAKKGDIPTDLYAPIKGSSYQQKERDLSKKYEITDYNGLDDLIEKAIKKSSGTPKTNHDLEQRIKDLETANTSLKKEAESASEKAMNEFKSSFVTEKMQTLLNNVPFDFSDVKADELPAKRMKTQNLLKGVFTSEYSLDYLNENGNKIFVVKDKNGEIKKTKDTLKPVDPMDLLIEQAKEYNLKLTSPDGGGQGGSSSQTQGSFTNHETYLQYLKANNIREMSKEAVDIWAKSGLKE